MKNRGDTGKSKTEVEMLQGGLRGKAFSGKRQFATALPLAFPFSIPERFTGRITLEFKDGIMAVREVQPESFAGSAKQQRLEASKAKAKSTSIFYPEVHN